MFGNEKVILIQAQKKYRDQGFHSDWRIKFNIDVSTVLKYRDLKRN